MLKGFSHPLSPSGLSSLAPTPPWHFASTFLAVEYWADPDAVISLLPPGLEPGEDPGRCCVFMSDNQYVSDSGAELLEPSVSQYLECFIGISATYKGKPAGACPFIYVDNDNSMLRGWVQGMPKQLGTIRMMRPVAVNSPAAPQVAPGGRFAGTLSARDRRLVSMNVTLEEPADEAPNKMMVRMINVRHFPQLSQAAGGRPAVHELVRQRVREAQTTNIWKGRAELEINDSPCTEMGVLKPVRIGSGYRYNFSMSVDDLMVVEDLRAAAGAQQP